MTNHSTNAIKSQRDLAPTSVEFTSFFKRHKEIIMNIQVTQDELGAEFDSSDLDHNAQFTDEPLDYLFW